MCNFHIQDEARNEMRGKKCVIDESQYCDTKNTGLMLLANDRHKERYCDRKVLKQSYYNVCIELGCAVFALY